MSALLEADPQRPACAVAIIGVAGRFPGAPDVPTFWQNLCTGTESIRTFTEDELEDAFSPEVRARPEFVRARAIVDGVEDFDAGFFGMHAREAERTDPQHRLFLECSWNALEDAGYDPATFTGAIGVVAGNSVGSYLMRNVLSDRARVEEFTSAYPVSGYPELLGSGYDFLATRVAYKLNLRGPAMTVQSACSTSLLAVTQAATALMMRQADMMLAGGVSISFPQRRGYLHQDGGMVSSDGHCRPFDAQADGTVFGDGVGVVLLKRLDDALAAGDTIYAVIRGFGVNNDGSGKVGYTAPSAEGQAQAIRAAHAMAGFEPATIGFVECHGTATPLGDPIEFAALSDAFGPSEPGLNNCALGSVKSNVGHLDVAAGITGLIKAALAVRTGEIPPTLHFSAPSPRIDLAAGPFFVNSGVIAWPDRAASRRAGVSAFGVGGTNVHVVLESAPGVETSVPKDGEPQLLVLSARSEDALAQARTQLAARLRGPHAPQLADVAHTLQVGRRPFATRYAVTAASAAAAATALESADAGVSAHASGREPVVAFMFPGQGSQYAGMGSGLYEHVRNFRERIDHCAEILAPIVQSDLRTLLFERTGAALTSTEIAQPALFALEYALAKTLTDFGIRPAAAIGHSVGEFVAATLSGVLSLDDALALVAERGRLMRTLPPGAMLAVRASEDELAGLLSPGLDLAALNAPRLAVVSGPLAAVEQFEQRLAATNVVARRLHTSHAFHSAMMDPVVVPLTQLAAGLNFSEPVLPYVSSVTGTWITNEEATSAAYWARHCRVPVRFADGLQTLVDSGVDTLVEVGPGATLATFALQGAAKGGRATVVRTLPGNERERGDREALLEAVGRLWTGGSAPDWGALRSGAARSRVSLPTYPFERTRYWLEPSSNDTPERIEPNSIAMPLPRMESMKHQDVQLPAETPVPAALARAERVHAELVALLEDLSGERIEGSDPQATFLELGFDSLFLGRFVQQIQTRFGVATSFRQLLSDVPTIAALAEHLCARLPAEATALPTTAQAAAPAATASARQPAAVEALMREQLQAMQDLMRQQLQALEGLGKSSASSAPSVAGAREPVQPERPAAASPVEAFRVAGATKTDVTSAQRAHIDELIARTVARTGESKRLTQRYRNVLADPRVAAGFRSEWKEMVYPITCVRAKGSRIWDADGNEYIDLLNGFGQTAFGHSPDFVVEAVSEQLHRGFAIGPQTDLAGQVAELFCELTGNERVTFCNTGSEAVMAALRVARTVTNRDRVVIFEGSYHGQFDEVLVKSARTTHRSLPVALGIPGEAVANITVLPYGVPESLAWVRDHRDELAAVLVESVQSRHPALAPREFLTELRAITEGSGTALIFDEVVTGFRMHTGGMQAIFGIKADLATYGKVVGGGLPIGILAGTARFMDALDGGAWQYGDDSFPEVAPTFIAGTFVRHPLAMAAVLAVLRRVKAEGPELQAAISRRTAGLVERLNADFERRGIASRIETYGSVFYLNVAGEDRLANLLFFHLRLRGIYLQEGFPSFLGTEHTEADVDTVVRAFSESLDELQSVGILPSRLPSSALPAVATQAAEVALTEGQTEIWLAAQVSDDASCAFNESVTLHLRGVLAEPVFQAAWDRIVARHDALRARFGATGELMEIAAPAASAFPQTDLSDRPASERDAALRALVAGDARTPFDLPNGPLVRAHLVRLSAQEHAFVLTAHHIICDGWSMNVILSELGQIYSALRSGQEPQLDEALSFASYARQLALADPERRATVEAYWLAQFADRPAPLELPTDRPRAAQKTYNGATRTTFVDGDAYRAVKKAGARQGCTLFVTLLAAFNALVGRLADQDDVVVGVPAAGQALLGDRTLVGHCVDFLPIRTQRADQTTVSDYLSTVKRQVIDAYEHQEYTLGTLVRNLELQRENNRVPIAEIQFNLERLAEDVQFGALQTAVAPNPKAFVNFDVFLNVVESADGLRLDCDYNTDLFDATTIDGWLGYYRTLLEQITEDAARPVAELDFLSEAERERLDAINATAVVYPSAQTIHGLFLASASANPNAIAVRFGGETVTYAALERRVNAIANNLQARVAIPGRRVAVCLDRSPDLIAALLGVLRAGCSYVPLDPAHPPARLRRILDDAGVAAVICDDATPSGMVPSGVERIDLRDAVPATSAASSSTSPVVSSESTAYIIYTSGTTGSPKGVAVTHRSVVNVLTSMARRPGFGSDDVLLAVTTVSFDIAALELFLPLVTGGTVAIASREEAGDPFALVERARIVGATAMQATPALWQLVLAAGFKSHAGFTMLCGGEALSRELADRLLAGGGELWNVYGPTETTIWSSCANIEAGSEPISVGGPIANTQFYVLDRRDRPMPIGVAGQLHIGGDGVAQGYLDRPSLTSEKFVPNPFGAGRLYRTGDRARITRDGRIQILGRLDQQVKLRGFRIELGEVEIVVQREAGFAEVAVVLREDVPGERRLACYYVETDVAGRDAAALRALAAPHLPDFMIPSAWVKLDHMPLTPAGKIDRHQLPAPEPTLAGQDFRAPQTATELLLAGIWADVLHRDKVGLDDDFFALGGDSIQLFQITARANRAGIRLAAKELLRHPTIAALAERLDEIARTRAQRPADAGQASIARLRPSHVHDRGLARRVSESAP